MGYKVFFHRGPELGLKTKALKSGYSMQEGKVVSQLTSGDVFTDDSALVYQKRRANIA
jgi:hypothetical protein